MCVVTLEAILATGVVPRLCACFPGCRLDRNVLGEAGAQQLGVAVVWSPFVNDPVDATAAVTNQQPRFQAAFHVRMSLINGQLEGLDEHGPGGKNPVAGG